MLLQDFQGISPNLSKNRCRINIPIVAWKYEMNIQLIPPMLRGMRNRFLKSFGDLSYESCNKILSTDFYLIIVSNA